MSALLQQRCLHHPVREAVARCPECGQFFCRECITEHEDRVICSDCLRRLVAPAASGRSRWRGAVSLGLTGLSLLAAWFFFYEAGRVLLHIPSAFHDGTIWQTGVGDS